MTIKENRYKHFTHTHSSKEQSLGQGEAIKARNPRDLAIIRGEDDRYYDKIVWRRRGNSLRKLCGHIYINTFPQICQHVHDNKVMNTNTSGCGIDMRT